MIGEAAAGTGTLCGRAPSRQYAAAAGFSNVDVPPIDNDFYRYYRLMP